MVTAREWNPFYGWTCTLSSGTANILWIRHDRIIFTDKGRFRGSPATEIVRVPE